MPQLDVLTYFSQFVYLVCSFVGTYVLALRFIIPKVAGAQKLRQKLNSVASLTEKLNHGARNLVSMEPDDDVTHVYFELASENLSTYATPKKPWLSASRMAQLCVTANQRKAGLVSTLASAN